MAPNKAVFSSAIRRICSVVHDDVELTNEAVEQISNILMGLFKDSIPQVSKTTFNQMEQKCKESLPKGLFEHAASRAARNILMYESGLIKFDATEKGTAQPLKKRKAASAKVRGKPKTTTPRYKKAASAKQPRLKTSRRRRLRSRRARKKRIQKITVSSKKPKIKRVRSGIRSPKAKRQRMKATYVSKRKFKSRPISRRPRSPISSRPKSPISSRPSSPTSSRPRSPISRRPKSPISSRPSSPTSYKKRRSPTKKRRMISKIRSVSRSPKRKIPKISRKARLVVKRKPKATRRQIMAMARAPKRKRRVKSPRPKTPPAVKKEKITFTEFNDVIKRMFPLLHPGLTVSPQAVTKISGLLSEFLDALIQQAVAATVRRGADVMSSMEIHDTVFDLLPKVLSNHAQAEGSKAVFKSVAVS